MNATNSASATAGKSSVQTRFEGVGFALSVLQENGWGRVTTGKHLAAGRTIKAFNPVARPDYQLFVALMSGEHAVHGFANRDLRAKLESRLSEHPNQQSAQVSRLLHRLHVYGLVAKVRARGAGA